MGHMHDRGHSVVRKGNSHGCSSQRDCRPKNPRYPPNNVPLRSCSTRATDHGSTVDLTYAGTCGGAGARSS